MSIHIGSCSSGLKPVRDVVAANNSKQEGKYILHAHNTAYRSRSITCEYENRV
jgi:hypothetical protein